MPKTVIIIPARLGSTRLPGKVLLKETGKPLIRHVWERAKLSRKAARVVIATDETRVLDAALAFGAEAVMTGTHHPNGTSRLAEAAAKLHLDFEDLIINVQGDEPEIEPESIDAAAEALEKAETSKAGCQIGTIAVPFQPGEDARDPNCVKVICTLEGLAMYFSRSLIPFDRDAAGGEDARPLRHVGIYAYRKGFLDRYVALPATPAERAEQLEQLRALQHGYRIAVALRPSARVGIDTPEQYAAFVARVKGA